MQISAFMSNLKCLELARRLTDQVPQTVTEMMKRVDDFFKSEEGYKNTELPKGEHPKRGQGTYDNRRFKSRRQEVNQFGLEALIKRPKEILATELQLQLPPCLPMIGTPKKENLDRYCDYHGEKGHYTNNCYQLKRQLEAALESGKLNHLVKDVRQRGNNRGRQAVSNNTNGKVINMVYVRAEGKKRKCQRGMDEDWMNVPITFPSIQPDDVSDEPLIIKAEVEGYLVRRVFVDQGAAVQVMLEHCFRNLPMTVQARLMQTHTELVGFSGEQLLPMGKIELEVMFGSEGLCRKTTMKFTLVKASSSYNIILGRTRMKELRAISSIMHAMMKFPTPRGIATLVPQTAIPRFRKKQNGDERSRGMDQGRYCKAGAVPDVDFQSSSSKEGRQNLEDVHRLQERQLGRNLEAYVDDMVIKSKTEQEMIMDITETFDNLRKVNIKLNLKKCSFGVKEGKFLGYVVTSERIRANPKKTKAVADMQSPRTLKECKA
ncbi:reverse transcriptase domain-containing protein [Tanacetum coccineum]